MKNDPGFHEGLEGKALRLRIPEHGLISDYLDDYARRWPEREAAVLPGGPRYTYGELAALVARLRDALLRAGLTRGDVVAVLSEPRPEPWALFLAAAGLGITWVGLNPRHTFAELDYVIGDARPRLIVAWRSIGDRDYGDGLETIASARGVERVVLLDEGGFDGGSWQSFCSMPGRAPDPQPRAREMDPALLVYTSGTTGRPKGALLPHHGLVYCSRVQAAHFGHAFERTLNNLPISHIGCMGDLACSTLVAAGCIVFMERFDASKSLEVIASERVTLWGQVPTMFQIVVDHQDFAAADLSSLRFVIWSGAMMPRALIGRFRRMPVKLASAYGMTELIGNVTFVDDGDSVEAMAETIGRPDPAYQVRVAGLDGALLAAGEEGEIQVRGDHLMIGYLGQEEATAASYTPDGWFKTGDAAVLQPDGMIRLVGRLKEMFKSGGYNVYPREVEEVLERHPAVAMAAIVAVSDPLYQEVGHAYVLAGADDMPSEEAMRQFCRERLANYKVPKSFTIATELPMLPIGKIDKQALRARAND